MPCSRGLEAREAEAPGLGDVDRRGSRPPRARCRPRRRGASKMRRLALPSAVVRSSKLGCACGAERRRSRRAARERRCRRAPRRGWRRPCRRRRWRRRPRCVGQARAPCAQPRAISASICVGVLRRARGEHLGAALGDHHVVLDADADVAEALRHPARAGAACRCPARSSSPCPARAPATRRRSCSRRRRARRAEPVARCGA